MLDLSALSATIASRGAVRMPFPKRSMTRAIKIPIQDPAKAKASL